MKESDFIDLYLTSFKNIGFKSIDKVRLENPKIGLFKHFSKKFPEITIQNYQSWRTKFEKDLLSDEIEIISQSDSRYSEKLLAIHDAPRYLFCKGNISLLKKTTLAIVGSRNPTSYGITTTKHFASELSKYGFVIVSGLATGIDSIAHRESIENGTIAVLGSGHKHIYPAVNYNLYKEIIQKNGLVISEYQPSVEPVRAFFPLRSRIIAGLSVGLLVTEAAEKSGSLIASTLAFEYGRNLYAIPGDITKTTSAGCNQLISKNLAKLARIPQDIIEDFSSIYRPKSISESPVFSSNRPHSSNILIQIKQGVTDPDLISQNLGLDSGSLLTELTLLEMENQIERTDGEIYLKL